MPQPAITVLGAGLQGSCVALGLARRGYRATLLERRRAPMLGASARNEGKIHMGFVYALDAAGATRRRMLQGAMTFAPLLDELCGPLPWRAWRSEGFRYAVMPDSLAGPEVLECAYAHLRSLLPEVIAAGRLPLHYLGGRPGALWRRALDRRGRPRVDGRYVEHCYETEEASIDPRRLAAAIVERLRAERRIELRCDVRVRRARSCEGGFLLDLETAAGREELGADVVVNCTWDDRARLDRGVGLEPQGPTCYRVKHQVLVRPRRPDPLLAPVTMVQGPFGDLVPWRDGSVYISWYPECRTYFGSDPPPRRADRGEVARKVARRALWAVAELFPGLSGAEILSSVPCTIIARGASDVDDPKSALHVRESFGPRFRDGWCTVDTGKLTTAPLNAERTVERIEREIGRGVA